MGFALERRRRRRSCSRKIRSNSRASWSAQKSVVYMMMGIGQAFQPASQRAFLWLLVWIAGWLGGKACNASISRLDWWWSIIIIWKPFPINHFCLLLSAPPASAPPGSSIVFIRSLLCAHNAVTSWFDPVSAKHRWGVWCLWLNHKDEEQEEEKPTGTG